MLKLEQHISVMFFYIFFMIIYIFRDSGKCPEQSLMLSTLRVKSQHFFKNDHILQISNGNLTVMICPYESRN